MSEQTIGTTCVQGGYHPGDAEPRQVPIYQSTTWKYDTSEHMGKLFDLEESGYFYSRLQNPTCDLVAAKICEMEGGTAAMLTSSGMAANFLAIFNVAGAGDHVVASSAIYGGTYNLLAHTMGRMGLTCTFVAPTALMKSSRQPLSPIPSSSLARRSPIPPLPCSILSALPRLRMTTACR